MKKLLYIIPVLLLTIFLKNNVYGAEYIDKFFYSIDSLYDYLENNTDLNFDKTYNLENYETLKKSELFLNTLEKYDYYIIFYDKVYFFNLIPYLNAYRVLGSNNYNLNFAYVFKEDNPSYAYFNFSTSTGNPLSTLTESSLGSGNYTLTAGLNSSISGSFFPAESFEKLFDSNFELKDKYGNVLNVKNPEFNFVPTYSENYETCNLKIDIKNPPDYYTLEYAINSSTSTWYTFDNSAGITVEDNCLVIVRMLDENGDEVFANSFSVSLLDNQLSTTYFKVDFDNPGVGHLNFTPIIYYNFQNTFDLYLSINSSKEVYFTNNPSDWYVYNNNDLISNLDYFKISSGNTYRLISKSTIHDFDITLNFKLVNKTTGVTGLERSFSFNMGSLKASQAISSTTNNIKDSIFNAGGGSNINDNLFASDSLEIDWSMENSKNTIQSFFESTLSFFNLILSFLVLMPAWITVPLNTLFVLTIVIFVFHVIRG